MTQISHFTAKLRIVDDNKSDAEFSDFDTISWKLHEIAAQKRLGKHIYDIKASLLLFIADFNSFGTRTTRLRGGIVVEIEDNAAPESCNDPVAILT